MRTERNPQSLQSHGDQRRPGSVHPGDQDHPIPRSCVTSLSDSVFRECSLAHDVQGSMLRLHIHPPEVLAQDADGEKLNPPEQEHRDHDGRESLKRPTRIDESGDDDPHSVQRRAERDQGSYL